jgi:hypothetical protein
VVLTHFSLARLVEGERTAIPKEQGGPGAIYRPPESLDGERTPSCDQYGLAVTYYHLRTGRLPRAAYGAPYVMAEAIRAGHLGLDDLPGPEREVVEQATDRDTGRRFATCADLVRALKKCPELPLEPGALLRPKAASAVTITPIVTYPPQKVELPGLFPTQTPTDTGVKPPDEKPPQTSPRPPARGPAAPPESDWNLSLLDSNYTTQPPLKTLTRDEDPGVDEEEALEEIHEPDVQHRGGTGQQASGRAKRVQDFIPTVAVALTLTAVVLVVGGTVLQLLSANAKLKKAEAELKGTIDEALEAVRKGNFGLCRDKVDAAQKLALEHGLEMPVEVAAIGELAAEADSFASGEPAPEKVKQFREKVAASLPEPYEDCRRSFLDACDRLLAKLSPETNSPRATATEQRAGRPNRTATGSVVRNSTQEPGAPPARPDMKKKIIQELQSLANVETLTEDSIRSVQQKLERLKGESKGADERRIDAIVRILDQGINEAKTASNDDKIPDFYKNFNNDVGGNPYLEDQDQVILLGVPPAIENGMREQARVRIRGGLAKLANAKQWDSFLVDCKQASPNIWVNACRVECIAELLKERKSGSVQELTARRKDLQERPDRGDAAGYVTYVLALAIWVEGSTPENDLSLRKYAERMTTDRLPSELEVPLRAARTFQIMLQVAKNTRNDKNLLKPYTPTQADEFATLLELASKLEPEVARANVPIDPNHLNDLNVHLALAYSRKTRPDPDKARILTATLLEKEFDHLSAADAFCMALVHARVQNPSEPDGRRESLRAYLKAFDLGRSQPTLVTPVILYEGVIGPTGLLSKEQPSSLLGTGDASDQRRNLATLYSQIARAMQSQPKEWIKAIGGLNDFNQFRQIVSQLYSKAADLEEDSKAKAADIVQAGYELSNIPNSAANQILRRVYDAANTAIGLAKDYPNGYILYGIALILDARQQDDQRKSIARLRESIDRFEQARKLLGTADESVVAMLDRANAGALIELGNYDNAKREKYLTDAMRLANGAAARKGAGLDDWVTASNAREDVAWLLPTSDPKEFERRYEDARKAFDRRIELGPSEAGPFVARGRLRVKWAEGRVQLADLLDASDIADAASLDDLLTRAKKDLGDSDYLSPSPIERVEAHFWLARAARRSPLGSKGPTAEEDYKNALADAEKMTPEESRAWRETILEEYADLLVDKGDIDGAWQLAGKLDSISAVKAAWIRGRCKMAPRDPRLEEAWNAFGAGLPPSTDGLRKQDETALVRILSKRAQVRAYQSGLPPETLAAAVKEAHEGYEKARQGLLSESELASFAYFAGVLHDLLQQGDLAKDWYEKSISHDPRCRSLNSAVARLYLVRSDAINRKLSSREKLDRAIKLLGEANARAKTAGYDDLAKRVGALLDQLNADRSRLIQSGE